MKDKKPFNVLDYKYFAYGFSSLFIVLGLVFFIVFGGFNTGIDFGSGYSERVQVAPIGMRVTYKGEESVTASVNGTTLSVQFISGSGVRSYSFNPEEYPTVGDLALALKDVGVDVDVVDPALETSNFVPGFGFPTTLTNSSVKLNYATDSVDVDIDDIRNALDSLGDVNVQRLGRASNGSFQIRINVSSEDTQEEIEEKVNDALYAFFDKDNIVILQSDFVGPKFSADLLKASIYAVLIAIVLILIYIAFRFRVAYALSSILALAHDVLMMLAFLLVFRLEVSSTTIAAVLTIIGYSLNNTIVIFDRVRENIKRVKNRAKLNVVDETNRAVRQSFSRSMLTSITTLLAIIPLAILSSGDIKLFAINLTWGIVIGTYSSNFLAPAFLMFFQRFFQIDKEPEKVEKDLLLED